MHDLSTLEKQKAHYAAIRAKFAPVMRLVEIPARIRLGAEIYNKPIGPIQKVSVPVEAPPPEPPRKIWCLAELGPNVPEHAVGIPWRLLVEFICKKHMVSPQALFSMQRHQYLSEPRFELWFLAHRHGQGDSPNGTMNSSSIGRRAGRDHSTILHGIKRYRKWLAEGRVKLWAPIPPHLPGVTYGRWANDNTAAREART